MTEVREYLSRAKSLLDRPVDLDGTAMEIACGAIAQVAQAMHELLAAAEAMERQLAPDDGK